MKKTITVGIDNFEDIIKGNLYYVDKTKAIEELLTKQKFGTILFPRPRRFGKSLFISMLENFFDIEKNNNNLFKGLYISKSKLYEDNLNKYPVIHLDFKSLKASTYDSCFKGIKSLISKLYYDKNYVIKVLNTTETLRFNRILNEKGSVEDYQESISNLCMWLSRYCKEEKRSDNKVIVLIDEYDTPMDSGYNNRYYTKIMEIIRPMFSNAFKGNDYLQMGILTGVLRIGGESLFSEFNNPDVYDVMTPGYNDYFGFTKKETKELLEYYGLKYTDEVKEYYDGYNFNGTHIYNPWSILNYAKKKELMPYWINTGSNTLIKNLLEELGEEDKIDIENLILGNSLSFRYGPKISYQNIEPNDLNAVLNLMLVSGYLTLDKRNDNGYTYFKVPNKEVKQDLGNIVEQIMFRKTIQDRRETKDFIKALLIGDQILAEFSLNKMLESASYHDSKEAFYHGYVLSIFDTFINQDQYIVESNRESGYGRSDIIVKKKDRSVGIVIELKQSSTIKSMKTEAEAGIKQLIERNYQMEMKRDRIKNIHEYVIVFHGRKAIVRGN